MNYQHLYYKRISLHFYASQIKIRKKDISLIKCFQHPACKLATEREKKL